MQFHFKNPVFFSSLSLSLLFLCYLFLPTTPVHADQASDYQNCMQIYNDDALCSSEFPNSISTSTYVGTNDYQNCIESGGTTALCSSYLNNSTVNAPYTLLTPLPELNGICPSGSTCTTDNSGIESISSISLSQFISYAYKFMIALAVVLAVFMITVGGFEYMFSGAMETKNDARKKITDAVLGLILALVTYLLLYTIDPNLVSPNNLTIPPISNTTTNQTSQSAVNTPAPAAALPTQ